MGPLCRSRTRSIPTRPRAKARSCGRRCEPGSFPTWCPAWIPAPTSPISTSGAPSWCRPSPSSSWATIGTTRTTAAIGASCPARACEAGHSSSTTATTRGAGKHCRSCRPCGGGESSACHGKPRRATGGGARCPAPAPVEPARCTPRCGCRRRSARSLGRPAGDRPESAQACVPRHRTRRRGRQVPCPRGRPLSASVLLVRGTPLRLDVPLPDIPSRGSRIARG